MIRITTIIALVLSLIITACAQKTSKEENVSTTEQPAKGAINKDISVAEFAELYDPEKHILLDVRTIEEWDAGHLPNAVHLNFFEENFSAELDKLDKDKAYMIYCKSGGRSAKTLAMLDKKGFAEAYNIMGGFTELKASGVETVTD